MDRITVQRIDLEGRLQGALLEPCAFNELGVVVLGGSSGRVDVARAGLFAAAGAKAIAMRWFGGEGQVPGICEIPLESFRSATDRLVSEGCRRIAYVGTSKGAEAALLVAIDDPRIDAAVAISPSSVVWANSGPGLDGKDSPQRSSWTRDGAMLPFVHYDVSWLGLDHQAPIAMRGWHEQSLDAFSDEIPAATISIEKARGDVVLIAGEDDALWPSDRFAHELVARLQSQRRDVTLVTHPEAGHRVILPGEPILPRPVTRAWGGTDAADQALGIAAWSEICTVLDLQ